MSDVKVWSAVTITDKVMQDRPCPDYFVAEGDYQALRDERDRLRAALEVAGDDICSEYCGAGPCHKKCLAVQAALTPAGGGQDGQG